MCGQSFAFFGSFHYIFFTINSTIATCPVKTSSPGFTPTSWKRLSIRLLIVLAMSSSVLALSGCASLHLVTVLFVPVRVSNSPVVTIFPVPTSSFSAPSLCSFHFLPEEAPFIELLYGDLEGPRQRQVRRRDHALTRCLASRTAAAQRRMSRLPRLLIAAPFGVLTGYHSHPGSRPKRGGNYRRASL